MTTVLQVNLCGLIMLGGIMLAYAEGTGFPDALSVPLAVLALFVTDRWKLFRLPTRWANCLGLAAFGLGAWELSQGNIEARLLSLAHLLAYLTWIVLFLEKTPSLYWTMCALGLLHAALGAVLTSSGLFGLMLGVFLVIEVWTLTVFTLHRARQTYSETATDELSGDLRPSNGHSPEAVAARKTMSADGFLWNRRSRPVSTVQLDPNLRWISWPFVSGVAVTVFLSAGLGSLFFLFTPRIWVSGLTVFGDEPDQALKILQSGFAEEVQLGDIGQILESTHPVFELRLMDHESGQPLSVEDYALKMGLDEPVFRGSVLGEYEHGKWRVGRSGTHDGVEPIASAPSREYVVRQEFRLEPTDSTILFAMPPHLACRLENKNVAVISRRLTSELRRDDTSPSRNTLKYVVFSERPSNRFQGAPRGVHFARIYNRERDYYCRLPEKGLERMQALAHRVAQNSDNTASPLEVARRLEKYLKWSGEYSYSLDVSIDDPKIDAVEDFLFNRKAGHCEYFASALALMLRAVNIPARLVSGFKGGDLNPSTGNFVVQQRHAHAWVEALIDRQWLIFDATPASRSDSVKSLAPKENVFTNLASFFSAMWSNHVVGLSLAEQNSSLYTPLKERATEITDALREVVDGLRAGDLASNLANRSWRPLLSLLCGTALIWLFRRAWSHAPTGNNSWLSGRWAQFVRWLLPDDPIRRDGHDWRSRLSRWWSTLLSKLRGESVPQRLRVEFYERFLKVLHSAGLEPLPTQTSLEFVTDTHSRWRERLSSPELLGVPRNIVAQFYRVRFGGESLSADELRLLDQQLVQLEQQWRRRSPPR